MFIIGTLQRQKGVLLPNLGNFRVGPVVGDSSQKKIRPSFNLLEGRYGGVSQERPRYIIGELASCMWTTSMIDPVPYEHNSSLCMRSAG